MKKIATISANNNKKALLLQEFLLKKHNFLNLNQNNTDFINNFDFDLVIAIGGDGLMLHLLHHYYQKMCQFMALIAVQLAF